MRRGERKDQRRAGQDLSLVDRPGKKHILLTYRMDAASSAQPPTSTVIALVSGDANSQSSHAAPASSAFSLGRFDGRRYGIPKKPKNQKKKKMLGSLYPRLLAGSIPSFPPLLTI
jgi:hypothetical protein